MKDIPIGHNDVAELTDHPGASDLGYSGELPLDTEKYLSYLEDSDITETQKAELLATLWGIMRAFVELGWGVNSVHNFIPALKEISLQEGIVPGETQGCRKLFNGAAPVDEMKGTSDGQ